MDRGDVGSLIWVRFHSFLQYSIPGSASRVCLLWSAEWESAGASQLPLIRAFLRLPLLEESKFRGKKKETLCAVQPQSSIVALRT